MFAEPLCPKCEEEVNIIITMSDSWFGCNTWHNVHNCHCIVCGTNWLYKEEYSLSKSWNEEKPLE